MVADEREFIVTPWEVKGKVDYERLVKEFGTELITDDLLKRIEKHTGELHYLLRRKVFFSHRDLDWILDRYEDGEKFFLYTGRGPSGHTHLGHLIPWIFTQHLQEKFDVELYFQMTDDEKFLHNPHMTLKESLGYTYDNALDVLACGFSPSKAFIFSNIEYAKTLYRISLEIAKHITFSTVKAVFGFENSTNIGMIFFPSMQAAPCFLPCVLKGKNIPCLIPAAIYQEPYWRGIARFVAPKLGYYKPAQIHSKFLPGLGKGGKMSASEPETAIFTTDPIEVAERKIMNAFTGGRATVEEQRLKGGDPDICPIYHYYYFLFEPDDKKLKEIYIACKSGQLLCGEDKARLASRVKEFLIEHQRKRKVAEKILDKVMLRD
ncbi:MAG: tryptophan--tRNA ligase [Nitrososphaerales archaeon]|nr:tryptophan--tRNA ligase [Nitrososphaerales archaeon]